MKNAEYWRARFEDLEKARHAVTAKQARQMMAMFAETSRQIERETLAWYARLAANNGVSLNEARRLLRGRDLEEFRWTVQEYIRKARESAITGAWVKELENASARVHVTWLDDIQMRIRNDVEYLYRDYEAFFSDAVRSSYVTAYGHTAYEIQRGLGTGWAVSGVDPRKLERILARPWAPDGSNFSDRIWHSKDKLLSTLYQELTRSTITGEDPKKAIERLSAVMGTSKANAGRLIMTESAYFSELGKGDSFRELDVEEYEIVATLDDKTSEICQDMDGKHFPMSQYEPGVTAPPFHPNCRTTTAPYFKDHGGGSRAMRQPGGRTEQVPADMNYKEWSAKYLR